MWYNNITPIIIELNVFSTSYKYPFDKFRKCNYVFKKSSLFFTHRAFRCNNHPFLYYLNIYSTIIYVQGIYQCLVCFTIFKRLLFDIKTVEATYNWLPSRPEFTLSFDGDELINRAECFIGFAEGNIIYETDIFNFHEENIHTRSDQLCKRKPHCCRTAVGWGRVRSGWWRRSMKNVGRGEDTQVS